jgi:hypothetical protein
MDITFEMDFDGDQLREAMAENYAQQIEQGGIDCPTDSCDSENFDAEIWTTDNGGFDGAAVCRDCNTRIELDLEDSQAKESVKEIENQIDNLF